MRALRLLRRFQSTVVDGPPVTETNRAEATLKRFWKQVGIESRGTNSLTVTLDKRPLKTPSGNPFLLPQSKRLVASLVATEWENQKTLLKPHVLPMTSLVSRAIDASNHPNAREQIQNDLLEYLDTDTICFYQNDPPPLTALQTEHWDPLIDWARKTFQIEILTFDSILSESQPEDTKIKLSQILAGMDDWELAAMERATHATKSFIIALALVKKRLTVEQASMAARVEVLSQIQRWGEVEDTHDVDFHDIRRQLGSAACLVSNT